MGAKIEILDNQAQIGISDAFCVHAHLLSLVLLFVTPWTVAFQAPPSMEFSRQEYQSGLPFPSPGDLSNPAMEPASPMSLALAGGLFTISTTWEVMH